MNVLYCMMLALVLDLSFCVYFNREKIKNTKDTLGRIKAVFVMNRTNYIVIAMMSACGLAAFCFGQYYYHAELFMSLRWQVAIMIMIPIAVVDFKEQIIPNKMLVIGFFVSSIIIAIQVALSPTYMVNVLVSALIGAFVAGGTFLIASLFSKDGIGAGDIKMFFILGFVVAFKGIFNVLLYSMVISAVFGIVLLIGRKKKMKDVLPLAPFTLIGVILSIAFGV